MKYEYMGIVEMNGKKYNAVFLCGEFGSKRTLDTKEEAQKAIDYYVAYLTKGKYTTSAGGIGIEMESCGVKIDRTYVKRRKVSEWEML